MKKKLIPKSIETRPIVAYEDIMSFERVSATSQPTEMIISIVTLEHLAT